MNTIERIVYNAVKHNPHLKFTIVTLYQAFLSVVPRPSLRCNWPMQVHPGFFFGFHDRCPWSADEQYLLANRNLIGNRPVRAGDETEVGFFRANDQEHFVPIARSQAWDWQIGTLPLWHDAATFLFNDYIDGIYCTRFFDIRGKEVHRIGAPSVTISRSRNLAICYDFDRVHAAMPGYGFSCRNAKLKWPDSLYPDKGCLRTVDITSGKASVLFTLDEIRTIDPEASMKHAFHFFHHCLFNPNGNRFVFFHRWVINGNLRLTRAYICDSDGGNIFRLPTTDMVSHIGWLDDTHLLAYSRTIKGDGYYIFKDGSYDYEPIGSELFNSDGHPQYHHGNAMMVTDTYPDRFRCQYLCLYDFRRKTRYDIATTHLPWKFRRQMQVDLHPRWSPSGRYICFDSGHLGIRNLCTVDINDLLKMSY